MALVEPLVGHLLSVHKDTVVEGLSKIRKCSASNEGFSTEFLQHSQGFPSLLKAMQKKEFTAAVLQTVSELVLSCTSAGVRSFVLRDMCRGRPFAVIKGALSALSDVTLPLTLSALQFLSVAALHIPKVILSRFGNTLPFHLACFRPHLQYTHRRVRIIRVKFLVNLVVSSQVDVAETIVCIHGFLTHLLEDAAELLQEGTEAGVAAAEAALQVLSRNFIDARIAPAKKRAVLLAQKHTLRLLIKALGHPLVAERVLNNFYRLVVELVESPADFQLMRVDAEDKGMPNHLLFFILRHLRPQSSPSAARLLIFILHKAPDLIRPYFTRISSHLSDNESGGHEVSSIATIATLNLMTRTMLAPIPYHLAAGKARLEPIETRAVTFFMMSPAHVAEEVCPVWIAEYVHRIINGSINLLMLSFAIQLTYAILTRAKTIQNIVVSIQEYQSKNQLGRAESDVDGDRHNWDEYNAKVQAALMKAIPRREEFWHRMTQQLHHMMVPSAYQQRGGAEWKPDEKALFLSKRMFLLMELYSDVFHLRMSWISAVPARLPVFRPCEQPIVDALQRGEFVVAGWPPSNISALCSLLVSSLTRGVSMTKLHHITMSCPRGGIQEWPLLLAILQWVVKTRDKPSEEEQFALAWVARLLQWVIHSVTVRFVCELEEAFLWISLLNESTIPCFIHMINNLLQRSLSKSADRIAQELVHGNHGVLANAARTFVAKGETKSLASQEEGGGKGSASNQNRATTSNDSGRKSGGSVTGAPVKDMWVEDMQRNLSLLKEIAERVEQQWDSRVTYMEEALPLVYSLSEELHGKRRIALTLLQMEKEYQALQPLYDQVVSFCSTLSSPTMPAGAEEELQLQSKVVRCRISEERQRNKLLRLLKTDYNPSQWCRYSSVCWELTGLLLRRFEGFEEEGDNGVAGTGDEAENMASFCQSLLQAIVEDSGAVTDALLENSFTEGNIVGFLLLLLAAVRTLLYLNVSAHHRNTTLNITVCEDVTDLISTMILRTYTGTVSTADRIRYSIMLHIDYLHKSQEEVKLVHLNEDDESDGSTAHGEDDEVLEPGAAKKNEGYRRSTQVWFLSGVTVPQSFMKHRFLIMNHQRAPHVTPEVDMLSLIADMWTEQDVVEAALKCPVRLHNNATFSKKYKPGWELLRSIFPEFSSSKDVGLASAEQIATASVMDPRYFIPLLHAVLAMPSAHMPRRSIGTKCIPVLLRSLSFTELTLRCMGAAALTAVWTPSGPTRIVVGFARLKLTQLAAKKKRSVFHTKNMHQKEVQEHTKWQCPRLPTPISTFLITAMRGLGDAQHPIHNDIMNFLLETKIAFSDPVPLHRMLFSFPLACITTPIMIKQQEEILIHTDKSSVMASSTGELLRQLHDQAPVHLDFVSRIIEHGCQTVSDMKAMLHSETLYAVTMIISMVAASDDIRRQLLRSLHAACSSCTAVGMQGVTDGHILQWLLGFVQQLAAEYGKDAHMYGQPLFLEAIGFLKKLVSLVPSASLHGQQIHQQLLVLRNTLSTNGVSTKAVLDGVDSLLDGLGDGAPHMSSETPGTYGQKKHGQSYACVSRKRRRDNG